MREIFRNRSEAGQFLALQFGHLERRLTPPDFSGRGGLNHRRVAQNVCRTALAEGLSLNLFT